MYAVPYPTVVEATAEDSRSAAMIEVQGRRILTYNKGINEVCNAYNYGQQGED